MKNKGWTLVELFVAMTVVILISSFLISSFKPNIQKSKLFVYATISNLTKGVISITDKYNEDISKVKDLTYQNPDSTDDTFCLEMADIFSLSTKANCSKTATNSTVNLRFPNEVTIQGLATPWRTPYTNCEYSFKNIIIDIDGEKGLNKIWADRFPLRIFQGGKMDGVILPINCTDDSIYNEEGTKITLTTTTGKSPYCKQKFNVSGSTVSKNFLNDDQIINYDVFKTKVSDEKTEAKMIASAQSLSAADCMAYGGNGYLSNKQCSALNIKLATQCASAETCENCASVSPSICPMNAAGTAQTTKTTCLELAETNKTGDEDVYCFTLPHKPKGGMSFLLDSMMEEIN